MHDRPRAGGAPGTLVVRRAVDLALSVVMQAEWLARRPTLALIVSADLDVARHVRSVAVNVKRLADVLDRALESDPVARGHKSAVVDALLAVAMYCRYFVIRWTGKAGEVAPFNADLRRLRGDIDRVIGALRT